MFDAILHPFAWAISYVWVWIHDLLVLLGMSSGSGMAWVLSIVLLTILVRIAIIPLFLKQIRSSRAMQAIQPEMRKIQEKYKGKKDQVSRQKMMEETQALQRKHKVCALRLLPAHARADACPLRHVPSHHRGLLHLQRHLHLPR